MPTHRPCTCIYNHSVVYLLLLMVLVLVVLMLVVMLVVDLIVVVMYWLRLTVHTIRRVSHILDEVDAEHANWMEGVKRRGGTYLRGTLLYIR